MSDLGMGSGGARSVPHARAGASARFVACCLIALAAGLVFAGPASPARGVELARGPYLQQVTTSSALIVWRTSTAAACTLGYGPAFASEAVTDSGTQHVVTLAGLQPATRYDYRIRAAGAQLAGGSDFFVRTAPLPGGGAPVQVLLWGDSGRGNAAQMAVAAKLVLESADLALHAGDVIYPSGEAGYYDARYFQPYAALVRRVPVYATAGNHDALNLQAYIDAWYLPTNPVNGSELFYSFDWGDIHFVCLDTNASFSAGVTSWLTNDLQSSACKWKIVWFHEPPYSCGMHGSDAGLISTLVPIFEAQNVDLVLNGHDHDWQRSYPLRGDHLADTMSDPEYVNPAGTFYVVSGGGEDPRSTSGSCWFTARAISASHFTRLQLTGDTIRIESVGTSGQVLDHMSLTKTSSAPPPSRAIDLTTPNGGDSVQVGNALQFRWKSTNVGPVRIELSRHGANGPWETLYGSISNHGSQTWTASGAASDSCWARLSEAPGGVPSDRSAAAFRITPIPPPPPIPGPILARIDFQPRTAVLPAGFQPDYGEIFDAVRGYGWQSLMSLKQRDMLVGDPRDTFVDQVNNVPVGVWEIAIPNGDYRVSITCGDPLTSATNRVLVEGVTVIADVYTSGGNFVQQSNVPVTVGDGRLTVTIGGIGNLTRTKLDYIEIASPGTTGAAAVPRAAFGLSAVPNPFNPETRIEYTLPAACRVRLTVHDTSGRTVATLVDGDRQAGTHVETWQARDARGRSIPSGVYVCRIASDLGSRSVKLILVR